MTLTQALQSAAKRAGSPLPPPAEPFSSLEDIRSATHCARYFTDADYRHHTVCRWEATPAATLISQSN
jgi:hypothetical protein